MDVDCPSASLNMVAHDVLCTSAHVTRLCECPFVTCSTFYPDVTISPCLYVVLIQKLDEVRLFTLFIIIIIFLVI